MTLTDAIAIVISDVRTDDPGSTLTDDQIVLESTYDDLNHDEIDTAVQLGDMDATTGQAYRTVLDADPEDLYSALDEFAARG